MLVIAHSRPVRQALRNIEDIHPDAVRRRYGRVALFEPTEFGAFLALRLRAEHDGDVQVCRTVPFNEFRDVPESVRRAASEYTDREDPHTPYRTFASNRDLPDPESMQDRDLWTSSST